MFITSYSVLDSGIVHYRLNDGKIEKSEDEIFLLESKYKVGEVDADEYNDQFPSRVSVSVHQVYNPRYFNPDNRRNREKKKNLGIKRFFNFSFDGRGGQEYLIRKDDVPSKKKKLSLEMYSKWPRKKDPRKNFRKNSAEFENLLLAGYQLDMKLITAKEAEKNMEQEMERSSNSEIQNYYDREMKRYHDDKEENDRYRILEEAMFKEFDDELNKQIADAADEANQQRLKELRKQAA